MNAVIFRMVSSSVLFITLALTLIVYQLESLYSLAGFAGVFLTFILTASTYKSRKGKIEFIDVDNNDIYIMEGGLFTFKYRKWHFTSITNLRGIKTITISSDKIRNRIVHDVFIDIDNKETSLCHSIYNKEYNQLLNNFVKFYKLKPILEIKHDSVGSAFNKFT